MEERIINNAQIEEFAVYLVREEKSTATCEKYLRDVRCFARFVGDQAVTKETVVAWKKELIAQGYAVRSVNSMLASVNSLFSFLGWHACKVKNIRLQRQTYCAEDKELTKTEYLRLLSASRKNEQLNLVLQTICGTGIRVSELRYFTVEAVRSGEITVNCKSKTRTILVPGKLKKQLLNYAKQRSIHSGAVFLVWPEILTESVPNGTVGEYYYQKLECSDYDVTFSLLQSSLPDGLTLTQHGEIEGTPTKAGFWYVVVMAIPEAGEDYADTMEYEITIEEAGPQYYLEIIEVPDKVTYTAGETVDMDGLWVRIYTPEGFIDSRDGEYLTYSQNALTTLGEQKIKLTYEDAVEFFIVTVKAAPTEATTAPTEATTAPTEAATAPTNATTAPTEKTTVPETTASEEETKAADAQKPSKDAATAKSESTNTNSNDKDLVAQELEKIKNNIILPIIIGVASGIAVLAVGSVVIFIIMKRRR